MRQYQRALCWIRRDLRLADHTALAAALREAETIAIVFNFDPQLLDVLSDRSDRRLNFIHESLLEIDAELRERGSILLVRHGDPRREIPALAQALRVDAVYANEDYEPYALERDAAVAKQLAIPFHSFKDQVIFAKQEILNASEQVFKVFTPYKNAWLKKLAGDDYSERKVRLEGLLPARELVKHSHAWGLADLKFKQSPLAWGAGRKAGKKRLKAFLPKMALYKKNRDFPALQACSGISVDLRFGTISIREALRAAKAENTEGAKTWLSELIWRDFYQMILANHPHVVKGAYKQEYDSIPWPSSREYFEAWKEGRTGYAIIDAAMLHFAATGWMHNRLRMITASFLVKDLLVDWRLGEKYFASKLMDYDLAANNGGWQWCASTGCDAQPYFRIFNPYAQAIKFDPQGEFIREHIPEFRNFTVSQIHKPRPELEIVNHSLQRIKALALFKKK